MVKKIETKRASKKKYVTAGIVIAIVIGIVASVSSQSTQTEQPELTTAPEATALEGLGFGDVAPDFSLNDPQNGKITKETFSGKPIFIFFTTTWCTPCQIGAQNLATYDRETGNDAFNVLIVFVDERETNMQFIEWKKRFGMDDWYVAEGIEMAEKYKVKYLDTKYVLDKNGIIRWIDLKPLSYSTIEPVLGPLL